MAREGEGIDPEHEEGDESEGAVRGVGEGALTDVDAEAPLAAFPEDGGDEGAEECGLPVDAGVGDEA